MTDWYCPACGDLIEDEDSRIEHLVVKHNFTVNIARTADIERVKVSNRKPEAKE